MSEYQYYEFLAIDKPLTERQIGAVRQYSSRAEISPTRFVNEYNYGDFRGDPHEFLQKYFDVMVYVANWGTHRLMLKVPADLIDLQRGKKYCPGDSASLTVKGEAAIFDFDSRDENGGDWEEGEGWMARLAPAREALLAGDERVLYLSWLLAVQSGDVREKEPEPPVPVGLRRLSGPLKELAEFLRLDKELLAAAAEASPSAPTVAAEGFEQWLLSLPQAEKDQILLTLSGGADPHLWAKLRRQFRSATPAPAAAPTGRTAGTLLAAADDAAERRKQEEARRREEEQAKREAAAAAAREQHLNDLAARGDRPWADVQRFVESRQPKGYEDAVTLLKDLHDLAARSDETARFVSKITQLCAEHAKKINFVGRVKRAGLLPQSSRSSA